MWLGLSVILLINLLGGKESMTQMVVTCGTINAVVLVTPLVTLCSWRLLSAPGLCNIPVEFALSGIL